MQPIAGDKPGKMQSQKIKKEIMKTIYNYWKTENLKPYLLRKSYRIAQKLGIGRTEPFKYGIFITDLEWQEIKKYLDKDRRRK